MYIPYSKANQKKYYGNLFKKFLSWNMEEADLNPDEKQEIIEVFKAFIDALETYK